MSIRIAKEDVPVKIGVPAAIGAALALLLYAATD
jgi:hypothetical protein